MKLHYFTNFKAPWKPLAVELARRGHRVTFVGPTPAPDLAANPNITYQHVNFRSDMVLNSTHIMQGKYSLWDNIWVLSRVAVESQRQAAELPVVKRLIKE